MSWDAVILRIHGPLRLASEVEAEDYLPLGTLEAVAAAVRAAFPDAKWDELTRASRGIDRYTGMLIDLSDVETSHSIHISVGGPANPVPDLLAFANANGWVLLDCSTSEFIDPHATDSEGFIGYKFLWEGLPHNSTDEK